MSWAVGLDPSLILSPVLQICFFRLALTSRRPPMGNIFGLALAWSERQKK